MNQHNHAPPTMQYNKASAEKAEMDARIDTTGEHIGTFTKVKFHRYPSGAAGYLFDFKSSHGQEARNMFVCTINKSGDANEIGVNQVSALMCCLGVQSSEPVTATVNEWDYESRMEVPKQVYLYPDSMNRPIGVVLQKELYTNDRTGADAYRMSLVCPFHASSRRTAKEMIDKVARPERVDMMLETLEDIDNRRDNDARSSTPYQGASNDTRSQANLYGDKANGAGAHAPATESIGGYDDDIPF